MAEKPATESYPTLEQGRTLVSVLLPLPLVGPYDYAVQAELTAAPGDFVSVPLGSREVTGVVWDRDDGDGGGVDPKKIKDVISRYDAPPMPHELRRFVNWVASYTCAPPGAVLRMAMRSPGSLEAPKFKNAYRLGNLEPARLTPARKRLIEAMGDLPPLFPKDLAEIAGVSPAVVKGLIDLGCLNPVLLPVDPPFPVPDSSSGTTVLTEDQQVAADALSGSVESGGFDAMLLDGVTGSGKTEVYFEAVAAALKAGGQALILLPEIALTIQFMERFEKRFGCAPAQWHSDLASSERRRVWREVSSGGAKVVVGARSALFLPFRDLRFIVVDEEHEPAFKQEDGVVYNARDMAVVRANINEIPIVLASATPSLETIANSKTGRYRRLVLPDRFGGAKMPEAQLIDLRESPPDAGRWLSPPLVAAMESVLGAEEQVLLFLNRRGYAPLTLCRTCGFRLHCPTCSAWLVEHRFRNRLMCHHCGYEARQPTACPSCGVEGPLVACGPGIERIAEEVTDRFPDASVEILSSDRRLGPAALREIFNNMAQGRVDILIGTQMVAKGHHFPGLTLVGVVDGDLGLEGGDPRASERTFQLLSQVAGRAGRAAKKGRVLIQTRAPEHPVMTCLAEGDRDAFISNELVARERAILPPFGKLASLIISGRDRGQVDELSRELARLAPNIQGVAVLGPVEAPISLLRGRFRNRLLVKAKRNLNMQAYLTQWIAGVKPPNSVRITIDVDPYSFF